MSKTAVDEDTQVMGLLARAFYLSYCEKKNLTPHAKPYVPTWAIDYATTAVGLLGYDDDAIAELLKATA